MFVILLRFSENKTRASEFMDGHSQWLRQGFEHGVFLLAGSLQPDAGGSMIAHNTGLSELEERLSRDPFVVERVVEAEILEIDPKRADERLSFLLS
ncbi:MAG: hypothetical protein P8Y04_05645 [Desulfobulbaceae bacterium]